MNTLTALGIASAVFVAAFTARAYRDDTPGSGQSRRQAIVEAWVNIAIGFTLNFAMNMALLPLVGASISAADNFALGWVFTAASVVRQYALRRWFNARIHAFSKRVAER